MEDVADSACCLDTVTLYDKKEYESEFGVSAPENAGVLPCIAMQFTGCCLDYVRFQAADKGLSFFDKESKVYVDTRDDLGLFLVFEK